MNLNNLRGLCFHFSEVREVKCDKCKGTGILQEDWYQDGGDEYETMPRLGKKGDQCICNRRFPECGTGRRRVRVTGAVEVWHALLPAEGPGGCRSIEWRSCVIAEDIMGEWCKSESLADVSLRDAVITAFLAGELPEDIAKYITKEEL